MNWIVKNLWLIPVLPLLAAGMSALVKQRHRKTAALLAIGSMALAFFLSCVAFAATLGQTGMFRETFNFTWFQMGDTALRLGWVLDPLAACMLVMVTFVGSLIFIYSAGYMAHDENFARFFCFLALFAAAMLGVIISNNLLLLFICWELVGFTSYMLIGFWYHKPSAAAAAKKAFITTRIGDIGFFLGMLWLYSETGTLLFYDNGNGCMEQTALTNLVGQTTSLGMAASTAISLLIFCGAIGKSGQVPLHVWLPDAMEGPTPVSALIHAATMVAAGVFLVARVYPLMAATPSQVAEGKDVSAKPEIVAAQKPPPTPRLLTNAPLQLATLGAEQRTGLTVAATDSHPKSRSVSTALRTVTWVGAITAVFAALIAVAQSDIKRILAYSTVSQLGYMMMGLGVGGVAVGMFHLITHAFFKALLFLGAGSVIHGSHEEQDIRRMGGLTHFMPITSATYAIGMMALSGVPLFAGFWSKDEILHNAAHWSVSSGPFWLGVIGALLTAFYMTRQVCYVFLGQNRASRAPAEDMHAHHERSDHANAHSKESAESGHAHRDSGTPHESPPLMTVPLLVLAIFAVLLGFLGTPAWPWFQEYLTGHHESAGLSKLFGWETSSIMLLSVVIVAVGLGAGWRLYGRRSPSSPDELDPLEKLLPGLFGVLRGKFFVDELYEASVVRINAWSAWFSDRLDRNVWNGAVKLVSALILGLSWITRFIDEFAVNLGFDKGCGGIRKGGQIASAFQAGPVQSYLRVIGLALVALVLLLSWGCAT